MRRIYLIVNLVIMRLSTKGYVEMREICGLVKLEVPSSCISGVVGDSTVHWMSLSSIRWLLVSSLVSALFTCLTVSAEVKLEKDG